MKLNKKVYRWIIEITLILVVIFAVRLWQQQDVVSGLAPNINATMLNGEDFNLYQDNSRNNSRPILVHFWASWCPVCKLEQSNIENIAKKYSVITVAMQSGDNNEVKQFLKNEKLSFNVINDEHGVLSQAYGIKGVPASFIVNKEDEIEFVEVGYTTELGLQMRLWWAGL